MLSHLDFASRFLAFLFMVCGINAAIAKQPEATPEQVGAMEPYVVCPPQFSVPIVVTYEELLARADELQPKTAEGWIVRNRPVAACSFELGDAASRAYERFEYPLRVRNYDSQIRLARAEVESWKRRLGSYRYFNKTQALTITVENAQLALLEASERLRNLRYERTLFVRHHYLERQLQTGVIMDREVAIPADSIENP